MRLPHFAWTENKIAYMIGVGLALWPIHNANQPGISFGLFLPWIGLMLVVYGCYQHLQRVNYKLDFGPKYVWIPLLLIPASALVRIAVYPSYQAVGDFTFMGTFFVLYAVSRQLGAKVFQALIPFVVISSVGVIVQGVIHPGEPTGGIVFARNYDIATGYLLLGLMCAGKWRLWLSPLVLGALYFTGSSEAVFAVAILGIILIVRRDWSKDLLYVATAIAIVVFFTFIFGWDNLYSRGYAEARNVLQNGVQDAEINATGVGLIEDRWARIEYVWNRLSPLGHGLTLTRFESTIAHNTFVLAADQLGPLAGLSWLWVTIVCLVKTRWKYAWLSIMVLSVFDHFIWTQWAPFWWALTGVSTAVKLETDLVFRKYQSSIVEVGHDVRHGSELVGTKV